MRDPASNSDSRARAFTFFLYGSVAGAAVKSSINQLQKQLSKGTVNEPVYCWRPSSVPPLPPPLVAPPTPPPPPLPPLPSCPAAPPLLDRPPSHVTVVL